MDKLLPAGPAAENHAALRLNGLNIITNHQRRKLAGPVIQLLENDLTGAVHRQPGNTRQFVDRRCVNRGNSGNRRLNRLNGFRTCQLCHFERLAVIVLPDKQRLTIARRLKVFPRRCSQQPRCGISKDRCGVIGHQLQGHQFPVQKQRPVRQLSRLNIDPTITPPGDTLQTLNQLDSFFPCGRFVDVDHVIFR
ncbi:Uncharacterised protein [Klebsiella pneumoniae]|nr:Uncharacterised protein [Klebsiella pneumoniae]